MRLEDIRKFKEMIKRKKNVVEVSPERSVKKERREDDNLLSILGSSQED